MGIINELKPGTKLTKSIVREDGTLILNKGTTMTDAIMERLGKFNNIRFLEDEVEETVDSNLRSDTEDALDEFLKNPNDSNIEKVRSNAERIVEMIESSEDLKYNLGEYFKETDNKSSHSVRTACFSILLAKAYNDSLKDSHKKGTINLKDIAVAALLQDVGTIHRDSTTFNEMTQIPKENVIERFLPGIKDTPFDEYDERYSQVYSYCTIAEMKEISTASKLMILLSKEPETEHGALKVSPEVSKRRTDFLYGAKIINACSIYDNAIKRVVSNRQSLEEVVAELGYCAKNGIINSEVLELLMNTLRIYPRGTKVLLSTGEAAVVLQGRTGQYDSVKPVVSTSVAQDRNSDRNKGRKIDLSEVTDITITSVLSEEMFESLVKNQIEDMKQIVGIEDEER